MCSTKEQKIRLSCVSVAMNLMNIKRHLNTMRFVYVSLIWKLTKWFETVLVFFRMLGNISDFSPHNICERRKIRKNELSLRVHTYFP